MSKRIVALIPARAGSKRVPGKNTRELAGHPLLAYAIAAAQEAGIFERIVVSTETLAIRDVAKHYGADFAMRPEPMAVDDSADIQWLNHTIGSFGGTRLGPEPDAFAIIRPTSPFRRGPWIRKAWDILQAWPRADSIRAVRPCREHPAKMWRETKPPGILPRTLTEEQVAVLKVEFEEAYRGPHPVQVLKFDEESVRRFISPVMVGIGYEAPWHSMPTQLLPRVYTQTAALEIAWTRVLPGSISGQMVLPYYTEQGAPEALDINDETDWERAVELAAEHSEWLPPVRRA